MRSYNFSKLTVLLLALSAFSFAKSQDLGIPRINYPAPNQHVHLQYTYEVEFILKNFDSSPVPKGTLINFDLLLDKSLFQSYNLTLNSNPINAGDSITVTIPPLTLSTINPDIEVCVVVRLGSDPNHLNDTSCTVLPFSIDNNVDLEPNFLDIVHPDRDTLLVPGETIYRVEGYIHNNGTVTLPRDYVMHVQYTMYTTTRSVTLKTEEALAPNENYIASLLSLPKVQEENGSFDICMTVSNSDDVNAANNEYCRTFYVDDFEGIEAMNSDRFRSYYSGGLITVTSRNAFKNTDYQLFNAQGQAVKSGMIDDAGTQPAGISTSGLENGLYILQLSDEESRVVHRNKLLIQ